MGDSCILKLVLTNEGMLAGEPGCSGDEVFGHRFSVAQKLRWSIASHRSRSSGAYAKTAIYCGLSADFERGLICLSGAVSAIRSELFWPQCHGGAARATVQLLSQALCLKRAPKLYLHWSANDIPMTPLSSLRRNRSHSLSLG